MICSSAHRFPYRPTPLHLSKADPVFFNPSTEPIVSKRLAVARTGVFVPPPGLKASTVDAPKRRGSRKTGGCRLIAPYDFEWIGKEANRTGERGEADPVR